MSKILVCLFFFLPFSCLAQFTISGRVLNQANTKALANASVFLSGGTIGDKTSANGSFVLQGVKPGKYELVISIIGFESYHQTIILNDDSIILPDITIIPKTIALNDVSVKPKFDPDRARNLELFEREFLGMSELSKECKILNSELLDLTYNEATNTLTASSVDFLIIENKALGYRIKYLLSAFIMDHVDNSPKIDYANLGVFGNQRGNAADAQKVHFEGSALFENMKGTESQEKRWQKKRQQLYEGSEMHFLRSALTNTTEEEGFRVLRLTVSPNIKKTRLTRALVPFPLNADEIIKPTDQQGIYALGCNNDELHITYNKSHHFPKNGQMTHLDDPENVETTIVSFNIPYVFFDRNGGIVDPNSLSFDGAWAHGRIAELLPVDYEPPQVKNLANDGLVVSSISIAQSDPLKDSLLKIATIADSSIKYRPAEKLYLQFDKPYYAIGDTIWFKAYLFNAPTLGFSTKSGIMYVDIANDSNTFIKQYRLPVKEGITRGDIGLTDFPAGNYTLRAYTNWMRNFDTDGFFYKRFVVADNREQTWLANSKTTTLIADGKLLANVKLRLSDMNKAAVADKPVQLEVMAGNHHLYKQRVQTDANGLLDVNFKVPEKATGLALVAHDEENENKITIPINLNRAEHADVQFLPESGNLVAGLPSHVGFKAIGEDGRGITISGIVTDHNQKQVAALQSLHNGMGSFDLTIQPNEKYTAKVNLPGGTVKEFALPGIKNTGAVLDVKNPFDKDSVAITISATNDLVKAGDSYFLIGKSRGIICYAAIVSFKDGNVSRKVAKQLFPSGITHFILTNAKGQPLNERLVFIDHSDNLNVELSTDKSAYEPHDSISMHIMVTDSIGKPIAGNFSLAVTDDAQVKQDTLNNENIMTRLLLTSDLKGFVEEPGYYLQTKNAKSWQALDNLLLTQGWVNYDWQADKQHPAFAAENEFEVKGQVQNAFNGAVKATHVTLLSKSPVFTRDTLTDKDGHFTFRNFPVIDTPTFIIKAVNRHDKSANVGIVMADVAPPAFDPPIGPIIQPWYISSDTALLNNAKNNRIRIEQKYTDPNSHLLKEVKITAKKVIKDSQNLNGPGNADVVLDEKDMIAAGKKTCLDLIQEKFPGFKQGFIKEVALGGGSLEGFLTRLFVQDKFFSDVQVSMINSAPSPYFPWYFINDKPIKFIIDGIPFGSTPRSTDLGTPNINDIKNFLKYHNAEDIKGIELMSSVKYSGDYFRRFLPADWPSKYNNDWRNTLSAFNFSYVEITTRAGRGPVLDNTPGIYLYKPLALSRPQQFYKPKYTVNDATKHLPDLRSTIDWEPNITTDKNGKATVSFYAADKPATYTVIIEGSDGNGNLGYKLKQVKIKSKPATNKQKADTK